MKTNRPARHRFWLLTVLTLLAIPPGRAMAAKKPELVTKLEALNKPENLVGSWKSIGARGKLAGATMTLRFSEKGEFEMATEQDGRKTLEKGTYTVSGSRWPLEVTTVSGGKKHYLAITIMPGDQIVMDEIKSFDEADAAEAFKNSVTLARQGEAGAANSAVGGANNPEKLIGKWKSIGDPLALEGASMTMSYSDKGEFEMTMSEKGEQHIFKGTYAVNAAGSPLKIAVVIGEKKGYYALAFLPNDQIQIEEIKTADGDFKEFGEDSITMARQK